MRKTLAITLLVLGAAWPAAIARGDAVQETATLGPSSATGWPLSSVELRGARFFVEETTDVTRIGAHLSGDGELFGAIVRLDDAHGVPAGAPFLAEEVVAHTTFAPPELSADVLVDLAVTLEPGHYAVVFGSGAFGVSGTGAMPWVGQRDLFGASHFAWLENRWRDAETLGIRFRVVTDGPCPGDVDQSGHVGLADLLIVLSTWGPCPEGCAGDLNDDRVVDFEDLLIVLGGWGPCD